jgi:hypothetical protein
MRGSSRPVGQNALRPGQPSLRLKGRLRLRFAACLFLIAVVAACGAPSRPSSVSPQPLGHPLVFGWDGVDSRMLMASVFGQTNPLKVDPSTWTLNRAEWVKTPTAMTAPVPGILIYDSGRNRELLVGPAAPNGAAARPPTLTWEWDGQSWRERTTAHSLGITTQYLSGAYSPELRATVVIDTGVASSMSGEFVSLPTWLFDGTDWRSEATAHHPPWGSHVEYDATRHSIVALSLTDYQTWQFDGHDWAPIPLEGGATPIMIGMGRQAPAVALDQARGLWVVFGGSDGLNRPTETWTGDGMTWTQRSLSPSPPARWGWPGKSYMAWDPSHRRMVLFGGSVPGIGGTDLGDTWSWDGTRWTHLAGIYPNPSLSPSSAPSTPASGARTASPTTTASPDPMLFNSGDCTTAPSGSLTRIHANDDIVVQVPPGWSQTTDVGSTETVLIRFTAPGIYSYSPTTIEIASLIGRYSTAREGAQQIADPGASVVLDCQIDSGQASFFRTTESGRPAYRILLVHHDLLYMVTVAGSGGFDPRAIADAKSLLGSWHWVT